MRTSEEQIKTVEEIRDMQADIYRKFPRDTHFAKRHAALTALLADFETMKNCRHCGKMETVEQGATNAAPDLTKSNN